MQLMNIATARYRVSRRLTDIYLLESMVEVEEMCTLYAIIIWSETNSYTDIGRFCLSRSWFSVQSTYLGLHMYSSKHVL